MAREQSLLSWTELLLSTAHSNSQLQPRPLCCAVLCRAVPCLPQINQKNVHGQTPLMLACRAGAADCVRLLLEAGADATLFDELHQRNCLHYAGGCFRAVIPAF